jgi:hypothetical protein
VDDQPGIDLARRDGVEDAVVAQLDDIAESRGSQAQQQVRRRIEAGNGDPASGCRGQRGRLARDDERSDAVTQRCAGAPPGRRR